MGLIMMMMSRKGVVEYASKLEVNIKKSVNNN